MQTNKTNYLINDAMFNGNRVQIRLSVFLQYALFIFKQNNFTLTDKFVSFMIIGSHRSC